MGTHPIFESDFDCLTEHGIEDELDGLDFESETNRIGIEIIEEYLENFEQKDSEFDYENIIKELEDELKLPKRKCNLSNDDAETEMRKQIEQYNAKLEKERLRQAELESELESSKENCAFRDLEKILAKGKLDYRDKDDLLNSENFWNIFESSISTNDKIKGYWNQIHSAWKSLMLKDHIREKFAAQYADRDEEYLLKISQLWRSVANSIRERESKLEKFQKFLLEQAEPERFWNKGYCPVKEEQKREKIKEDLSILSKKVESILNQLEPICEMEIPWTNRSYREKMKKDKIEVFYFVNHKLRNRLG